MPSNHIRPSTILAPCFTLRISAACPVGPPSTYQAAVIRHEVNSGSASWWMLVSRFSSLPRPLSPRSISYDTDPQSFVLLVVLCSMIVLGLVFTAAVRTLHKRESRIKRQQQEERRKQLASQPKKPATSQPSSYLLSVASQSNQTFLPSISSRHSIDQIPPYVSHARRAALFRPPSGPGIAPPQVEGYRSMESVRSFLNAEDDTIYLLDLAPQLPSKPEPIKRPNSPYQGRVQMCN